MSSEYASRQKASPCVEEEFHVVKQVLYASCIADTFVLFDLQKDGGKEPVDPNIGSLSMADRQLVVEVKNPAGKSKNLMQMIVLLCNMLGHMRSILRSTLRVTQGKNKT